MRYSPQAALPSPQQTGPIIYCDGAGGAAFRKGVDLELSHWYPNRTPERFAADTSTEICMKFAASGEASGTYAFVVNNHVDIDGILSVFTVLEPELALRHRETVVQAAEMGDFWGWGERPAQALFQAMTLGICEQLRCGDNEETIYRRGFETARAVLQGGEPPEIFAGLECLAACVERIDGGDITRTAYHERFVHYTLPRVFAVADLEAALRVMPFNTPLSDRFPLLPHARARLDRERIALQSVQGERGWYYDLHYPGYAWAETPHSWRPPGLERRETSNLHGFSWPSLRDAVADLDKDETAEGRWTLATLLSPFSALEGRGFPVVLAFMDRDRPAPSHIPPKRVAERLASAFERG